MLEQTYFFRNIFSQFDNIFPMFCSGLTSPEPRGPWLPVTRFISSSSIVSTTLDTTRKVPCRGKRETIHALCLLRCCYICGGQKEVSLYTPLPTTCALCPLPYSRACPPPSLHCFPSALPILRNSSRNSRV